MYAFSEFVTPSCKWGKVACLQCKSYKFGPLPSDLRHYFYLQSGIIHVCLFLITRPLAHHKNKSDSSCEKIFDMKLYGQTLTAKYKSLTMNGEGQNKISLDKLVFRPSFLI